MKVRFLSLLTALLTLWLCLGLTPSTAHAMSVSPVIVDMAASGRQRVSDIRVSNTGAGQIPVGISVAEISVDASGNVTSTPAPDVFTIFPPQALIEPGALQRFRVQWAGEPDLAKSRSFLFSVAQQPVALPTGVSGVQILYNFQVIVNVAPPSGRANLAVEASGFETVEGKRRAILNLTNPTAVHAYLSGARVQLEAIDAGGRVTWTKTITPEEFGQTIGAGLVQPGAKRRFTLPIDLPEGGEALTASLRYVGRP